MLNNSPKSLHPDLYRVYSAGLIIYRNDYPKAPFIDLNETFRNEAIQTAYFAQGRMLLAQINKLRALAGLPSIKIEEASKVVSNARYGNSAHNFELSRAFDVRATERGTGRYLGDRAPYERFWLCCKEAADAMKILITWGGTWDDWPHIELTNWKHLKP
jgi:hypothetical protein